MSRRPPGYPTYPTYPTARPGAARRARLAALACGVLCVLAGSRALSEPPLPWNPSPPGAFREIWPVDLEADAALRGELGPGYITLHMDHFSLTHAGRDELARYRGEILESVYAAFVLFFDTNGFALEKPDSLLQTVFFQTRAELIRHLATSDLPASVEGLYRPDVSRAYFFDTLGRSQNRDVSEALRAREQELRAMQRSVRRSEEEARFEWKLPGRPERWVSRAEALRLIDRELRELDYAARRFRHDLGQNSLETMCHEAVHQLAHSMGVLRPDRPNPRWLSEGLASFFEPSRNGYLLETGAVHWAYWDALSKAHQRGERIGLRELLLGDALFADWSEASLAYYEAWSLVHYLATERTDALMRYLRALREVDPKAPMADRVPLFERHFGAGHAEIESDWRAHVEALGTPLESPPGSPSAEGDAEEDGSAAGSGNGSTSRAR